MASSDDCRGVLVTPEEQAVQEGYLDAVKKSFIVLLDSIACHDPRAKDQFTRSISLHRQARSVALDVLKGVER